MPLCPCEEDVDPADQPLPCTGVCTARDSKDWRDGRKKYPHPKGPYYETFDPDVFLYSINWGEKIEKDKKYRESYWKEYKHELRRSTRERDMLHEKRLKNLGIGKKDIEEIDRVYLYREDGYDTIPLAILKHCPHTRLRLQDLALCKLSRPNRAFLPGYEHFLEIRSKEAIQLVTGNKPANAVTTLERINDRPTVERDLNLHLSRNPHTVCCTGKRIPYEPASNLSTILKSKIGSADKNTRTYYQEVDQLYAIIFRDPNEPWLWTDEDYAADISDCPPPPQHRRPSDDSESETDDASDEFIDMMDAIAEREALPTTTGVFGSTASSSTEESEGSDRSDRGTRRRGRPGAIPPGRIHEHGKVLWSWADYETGMPVTKRPRLKQTISSDWAVD
jgi:hypothetical protein